MYESSTPQHLHELDHRGNDGVEVSLLWNELTNRVVVSVSDARTGDSFEILVTAADNALDVFEHPFAYAALRGIDYCAGAPKEEPVYA